MGVCLTIIALIIYTRVRVVRPFVCANCVRVYTIERAYTRAYTCICACTCICVSLRLFTYKNTNAVSYVYMRAFACLRTDLIKTQNAKNISTLKRTWGSETFRMYYIYMNNHIYSTLFKTEERESDRRNN